MRATPLHLGVQLRVPGNEVHRTIKWCRLMHAIPGIDPDWTAISISAGSLQLPTFPRSLSLAMMRAHVLCLGVAAAMEWTLAMQMCPGASQYTPRPATPRR